MSAGFVLSSKIFYEYKLYHPFEKYKSSDYFLNAAKRDSVVMEMKVEVIFQTWKWWENAKCCRELMAGRIRKAKVQIMIKKERAGISEMKKVTFLGYG